MKTRIGFVSNSSSSSFVIFLKEEDFNEVYNNLSALEKEMVNHLDVSKLKAFDLNLIKFSGLSGNDDSFDDFETDLDEEDVLDDGVSYYFYEKVMSKFRAKEHIEHGENF